jgi:catechol 2,3-dioxygenase-like lactoylglutathione lyase family enzyme
MKGESAVQFQTQSRIHLGLAVRDLARSEAFYAALLGQGPTKTRPHYAKFEVAEPPVNLALNEVRGPTGTSHPVAHFGIQVKSTEAVCRMADRLREAGLVTTVEDQVTCCYAVQNKVWATDPDGNKWEVYVVLDNEGPHYASSVCCADLAESAACEAEGERASGLASSSAACGCSAVGCC